VDPRAPEGILVEISGKPSGLTGWLFKRINFKDEAMLQVTPSEVNIRSPSLAGEMHHVVPLVEIASMHCGYTKPLGLLIIGTVLFLAGLAGLVWWDVRWAIPSIAGLPMMAAYFSARALTIAIETTGGLVVGLSFRPRRISDVEYDLPEGLQALDVLTRAVHRAHARKL
jgi:hypothetical protein